MTDFTALIDRVIARQTRSNLIAFLATWHFGDDGAARKLGPEETALVIAALDAFLVDNSVTKLGMAEFSNLYARLGSLAARDDLATCQDGVLIRNACFDALACIKALEARLAGAMRQLSRHGEWRAMAQRHANDP